MKSRSVSHTILHFTPYVTHLLPIEVRCRIIHALEARIHPISPYPRKQLAIHDFEVTAREGWMSEGEEGGSECGAEKVSKGYVMVKDRSGRRWEEGNIPMQPTL